MSVTQKVDGIPGILFSFFGDILTTTYYVIRVSPPRQLNVIRVILATSRPTKIQNRCSAWVTETLIVLGLDDNQRLRNRSVSGVSLLAPLLCEYPKELYCPGPVFRVEDLLNICCLCVCITLIKQQR